MPFLHFLVRGHSQSKSNRFFYIHSGIFFSFFEPLLCTVVIVVQEISVNKIKISAHIKQGARDPKNKYNKQVKEIVW